MNPHILVVEDEEHLASALAINFSAEGWDAELCADGVEAIERFEQAIEANHPFDIVVLDLMLPRASGFEVAQSIRAMDRSTPILVLSAKAMTEDRIKAFNLGADQYLQKPFALAELLARIRNLLQRKSDSRASDFDKSSVFKFGDSTVDFRQHRVTVRGDPQKLSHLHMQLLKLFTENEGTVLSRDEILERVWGHAVAPSTTRVVDNAVLLLRKTFEGDPSRPRHFQSVRGAGYRFVKDPGTEDLPAE
jgi:DNA-binding response OmpR family regulator